MLKRISAIALALLVIVALVGCGAQKREVVVLTLSTEDAEAILNAAGIYLPDEATAAGANSIVRLYGYQNNLQNYSEEEMIQTGYWTFREKYHSDIEYIECTWDERFTRLAALVLSNDVPDFYEAWATDFPLYSLNGVFQAVDPYIDYSDPLWEPMKYYADTFFSLGGHPYMFITDVQFNSIVLYNRRVFDEYGYDDPAELFYAGEWTWDDMLDMAIDFTDPDDGRWAFNNWHVDTAFLTSTGVGLVEYNTKTGKFESNLDDPRLERGANVLAEFQKNEVGYPMYNNGWVLNYELDSGGVAQGKTLFGMDGVYILDERRTIEDMQTTYGDIVNGEVMICPVPRDPDGDGEYYIDSKPKGYCLIKDAPNPEGVALLAACDRFKIVDPTVVNLDKKQLKEKKGWTDEMLDMWDEMYKIAHSHNTLIDYGSGLGNAATPVDTIINFTRTTTETSWAQRKEANADTLQYYLDDLNSQIAAMG